MILLHDLPTALRNFASQEMLELMRYLFLLELSPVDKVRLFIVAYFDGNWLSHECNCHMSAIVYFVYEAIYRDVIVQVLCMVYAKQYDYMSTR